MNKIDPQPSARGGLSYAQTSSLTLLQVLMQQERARTRGAEQEKNGFIFMITYCHPTNRTCALSSESLDDDVDGMFTSETNYIKT